MAPAERLDAARNRERILRAAQTLFASQPLETITMEEIAAAARVGKGTLYRKYASKEQIAVALLDEHERALQHQLIRGEPPLGPGAPAAARLAAFYDAMTELLEQHGHLALAAETGARRFATGAYGFWHAHVRALVVDAGIDQDPDLVADTLLAPLAPELYQRLRAVHQRRAIVGLLESMASSLLAPWIPTIDRG